MDKSIVYTKYSINSISIPLEFIIVIVNVNTIYTVKSASVVKFPLQHAVFKVKTFAMVRLRKIIRLKSNLNLNRFLSGDYNGIYNC